MRAIWLRLARSRQVGRWIPWMFEHLSFMLPVERLRETPALIAFYHPRPAYAFHILIVPKKAIPDLRSLGAEDQDFLRDLFQCVAELVREFGLDRRGYRLIANGGKYQEVAQLHFHLISESED